MIYIAKKYIKNDYTVEDIVMDSVVKIFNNIDNIIHIGTSKTKNYISIIVRNAALDFLKRKEILSELLIPRHIEIGDLSTVRSAINDMLGNEIYAEIVHEINALSDTLRVTVYLSMICGFNNQEIAYALNVSNIAVRARISRAKKILRQKLECVIY